MVDLVLLRDSAYQEKYLAEQPIPADPSEQKMYIIVFGKVGAYDASGRKIQSFGAGMLFGEQRFFNGNKEQTFRAEEACVVFAIAPDSFEEFARKHPNILLALLRDAYAPRDAAAAPSSAAEQMRKVFENRMIKEEKSADEAAMQSQRQETVVQTVTEAAPTGVPQHATLFAQGHKSHPGITKPAYKQYLFEKEYKCPNCAQTFKGWKVFQSKLIPSAPTRYDLRKYYKDFDASWYDVVTCPHCYFSVSAEYFLEPVHFIKAKIQEGLLAAKEELTLDFEAERDLDFVFASHYLALLCAQAFASRQKQLERRWWANLSWLYEDAGDVEMEKYAAAKSADAGEDMFVSGGLNKLQEQVVSLEIAGMLYRTGERESLSRWLFQAKSSKEGKRVYTNLAEDLWESIRAEMKK